MMTLEEPTPATPVAPPPPAPADSRGFWQRRVVAPVVSLLTMGVTPDRIAATLAVGTVCSLFPFLGTTTLLNLGVGLRLRMNQPILQIFNQLLTPVHLAMILAYVRAGEWMWGATRERIILTELVPMFREASFADFLQRFGWAGIHAFTAWALTAPLLFALVYFPLRPVMRRFAQKRGATPVP